MKTDGCSLKMPFRTKRLVRKTEKEFKRAGQKYVLRKSNKQGDIVLLGYKTPEQDKLSVSSIIRPDGSQKMMYYYYFPAKTPEENSSKVIEVWDRTKDDITFDKSITMQYGKLKIPKVITTVQSDTKLDDGVKITDIYPLAKYLSIFKRPE